MEPKTVLKQNQKFLELGYFRHRREVKFHRLLISRKAQVSKVQQIKGTYFSVLLELFLRKTPCYMKSALYKSFFVANSPWSRVSNAFLKFSDPTVEKTATNQTFSNWVQF